MVKAITSCLMLLSLLSGCASMKMAGGPDMYQADAITTFAEAFDEILGCPMDLTRKLNHKLSPGSCPEKQEEVAYADGTTR